ncbi:glycogen debranching protein GlgX [Treponema pedis]|uniref:glycogen debranching protein GlgX n=1 Tax=Treponema pedis TaxID=409322 RepID=UPI00041378A0|nr:glycogen debranching protein GlgX [Treponema pedis]
MSKLSFLKGKPLPLGAKVNSYGVNFCVFSRHASSVTLHLFENEKDEKPAFSFKLDPNINKTGDLWHIFVKGLKKGAFYLYTASGLFSPYEGHLFNENNFLLDPYAKQLTDSSIFNSEQTKKFRLNKQNGEAFFNTEKTAKGFPKCIVIDDEEFDWDNDSPINLPLHKCIIYEAHLKGMSFLNTRIDEKKRGKFSGLIEVIPYLKKLGITSLELLPVFEFDENENFNKNPTTGETLKNYWGYSTLSFFAPKTSYAENPKNAVNEFKFMVKEFHKAGIEIILDVVFNHSAEGNENGAVFSFKGFDNSIYYHLEENKSLYKNYSGCGNTVNASHPAVGQFIIDCLRYWVTEMHIDGFRFDLASILARNKDGNIETASSLLNAIEEDPVLRSTKIIAEPWDAAGGYMVGAFPGRWAEWNDLYRDALKTFWLQPNPDIRKLATRVTGSSDLYLKNGRRPYQSVNFICCHDGFTLYDLLSYSQKHNEENGENNNDGSNNNFSFNHGTEGPACDKIEIIRKRMAKNILIALLLSAGTPMLNMGDEVFRTQNGNNNAYCQDNFISWFDWSSVNTNNDLFEFTKKLINLRITHFSFIRKSFFTGIAKAYGAGSDLQWFNSEAKTPDWNSPSSFLAFLIDGNKINLESDCNDNDFYIMFNGYDSDITAKLPAPSSGGLWHRLIDTSYPFKEDFIDENKTEEIQNQDIYVVFAKTAVVLISK